MSFFFFGRSIFASVRGILNNKSRSVVRLSFQNLAQSQSVYDLRIFIYKEAEEMSISTKKKEEEERKKNPKQFLLC